MIAFFGTRGREKEGNCLFPTLPRGEQNGMEHAEGFWWLGLRVSYLLVVINIV